MSPLPLREQIVRRIRELVLSGQLAAHTQLPSIRGLAKEQRVGVITVQRAYEDLERDQIIYARRGKGYFVSSLGDESRRSRATERARQALTRPLHEARQMGLSSTDIERLISRILAEGKETS
jgi:GntR family transcriptional regulator